MKTILRTLVSTVMILIALAACAPAPAPTPAASISTSTAGSASTKVPATATPAPTSVTQARPTPTLRPTKEKVSFKSGDLTLVGYLYKPGGAGPFPSLISNHGSDKDPYASHGLDISSEMFVAAGYVVMVPLRRGHGESPGPFMGDLVQQEKKTKGDAAADQLVVQLLEGPELDDQLAGLAYLKNLPYVDKNRLGVIGCSYGGIETLFAAERGAGFKAAVAMSPAAESWVGNKPLQDRLIKAVSATNVPVFLIHPAKDVSLLPGQTLAKEFQRLGKPYELKIYPDTVGTAEQQQHCFGSGVGVEIWTPDVLPFFGKYLK